MEIVCHNRFGVYRGENAHDVLLAVHAEASRDAPSPLTFNQWKSYNASLWNSLYNIDVPLGKDPKSETQFLEALFSVGALTPGEKQKSAPSARKPSPC